MSTAAATTDEATTDEVELDEVFVANPSFEMDDVLALATEGQRFLSLVATGWSVTGDGPAGTYRPLAGAFATVDPLPIPAAGNQVLFLGPGALVLQEIAGYAAVPGARLRLTVAIGIRTDLAFPTSGVRLRLLLAQSGVIIGSEVFTATDLDLGGSGVFGAAAIIGRVPNESLYAGDHVVVEISVAKAVGPAMQAAVDAVTLVVASTPRPLLDLNMPTVVGLDGELVVRPRASPSVLTREPTVFNIDAIEAITVLIDSPLPGEALTFPTGPEAVLAFTYGEANRRLVISGTAGVQTFMDALASVQYANEMQISSTLLRSVRITVSHAAGMNVTSSVSVTVLPTCPPAHYVDDLNVCQTTRRCAATEFEVAAPTGSSDRECFPCGTGPCPAGRFEAVACSAAADRVCRLIPPPPATSADCVLSEWTSWSGCTRECGGGTSMRRRAVIRPSLGDGLPCDVRAEATDCNTQACEPSCPANRKGQHCEVELDHCGALPCNGGVCRSSHTCFCAAGYTGVDCATDINECLAPATHLCLPPTVCINTIGGYTCSPCPAGYDGDGIRGCTEIDNCPPGACNGNGICISTAAPPSFHCECDAGVTGPDCSRDVNECDGNRSEPPPCAIGSSCNNTFGSFSCMTCSSVGLMSYVHRCAVAPSSSFSSSSSSSIPYLPPEEHSS